MYQYSTETTGEQSFAGIAARKRHEYARNNPELGKFKCVCVVCDVVFNSHYKNATACSDLCKIKRQEIYKERLVEIHIKRLEDNEHSRKILTYNDCDFCFKKTKKRVYCSEKCRIAYELRFIISIYNNQ